MAKRNRLIVLANQIPDKGVRAFAKKILPGFVLSFKYSDFVNGVWVHSTQEVSRKTSLLITVYSREVVKGRGCFASRLLCNVCVSPEIAKQIPKDQEVSGIVGPFGAWEAISFSRLFSRRREADFHLMTGTERDVGPFYEGLKLLALCLGTIRPTVASDFPQRSFLVDKENSVFDGARLLETFPYKITRSSTDQ